jgi:hypothetical protein
MSDGTGYFDDMVDARERCADLRFTVEVETHGANAREHFHAHANRVAKERKVVELAWQRFGLARGVPGMLEPVQVVRLPRGVSRKDRELAKKTGIDLRRADQVVRPLVPLTVHLTRVSFGKLDPFENLPQSLKGVVDEVAWQLGVNDRDPIVLWKAHQEHGPKKYYAVKVRIVARAAEGT